MVLRDTARRLAFICIVFIILFKFPFISVFNTLQSFLDVPVLILYIFCIWVLFIIVLILFVRKNINSNKNTEHIKVIFLTAKAKESDIQKGLSAGADLYLKKPFATKELVKKVNEIF